MMGDRFRAHREALGLTQAALAERLHVSQSMVALVEIGMKMPSVGTVKLASELFGCTTDELIFGKKPERSA